MNLVNSPLANNLPNPSETPIYGVKTHLSQYGVGADKIPVIIEQLKAHGMTALSETQDLTLDLSQKILERAV